MSIPSNCQEKTGFLIMHACKNKADSQCSVCGKYMCSKHTHIHASAPHCEKCFKAAAPEEHRKTMSTRGGYYSHYHGYRPFYYSRYGSSDYDHFDRDRSSRFHDDATGS